MTGLLAALVLLPLLVGAALALGGRRVDRVAPAVGVAAAVAVFALAVPAAITNPSASAPFVAGAPVRLAVDGLAALMLVTVAAVTLLVLVFSAGDVGSSRSRFFGLMLLFAGSVLLTVTAQTLPALLFGWEVMGATSYALIGFRWRGAAGGVRVAAGTTAFLTTRLADLGLYLATGALLAGGDGTLSLAGLTDLPSGWRSVAVAGVLIAALGKAAQLPFSFWLSRAMEGPSPVSALLHSAAMVAMGGYLLLRVSPALSDSGWADDVAAWAGAVTALVLGVVAVAQSDLKQLLAASTAAQLGFVVLAAGAGGVAGGEMHLVAHAATKAALFLAAGAWLAALGTKSLAALRGAGRRYPLVGAVFAASALALAGVPPLSLWATKDEVLATALEQSPGLYVVGLAAALVSAVYAGKALVVVLRPIDEQADEQEQSPRSGGMLERAPLVVLTAGAVLLGLQALPPIAETYRDAVGSPSETTPGLLELTVSGAVALLGLGLAVAWRRPLPARSFAGSWLRLEDAAHLLVVRPTLALARGCAAADDTLHRLVLGVPAVTRAFAGRVRRADETGIDGSVQGIARSARRLGGLARRPQTGQLHQYYAQTVVGLAVALAVLLLLSAR